MIGWVVRTVLGWASSGVLDRVLAHYEAKANTEVERDKVAAQVAIEQVKAEIARRNAQRDVLLAGNRWLQWLFAVPLGFWWTAVILDSVFLFGWKVAALPSPLMDWAAGIVSALFLHDFGTRAVAAFARRGGG